MKGAQVGRVREVQETRLRLKVEIRVGSDVSEFELERSSGNLEGMM